MGKKNSNNASVSKEENCQEKFSEEVASHVFLIETPWNPKPFFQEEKFKNWTHDDTEEEGEE